MVNVTIVLSDPDIFEQKYRQRSDYLAAHLFLLVVVQEQILNFISPHCLEPVFVQDEYQR